jgi:hypothetical protein
MLPPPASEGSRHHNPGHNGRTGDRIGNSAIAGIPVSGSSACGRAFLLQKSVSFPNSLTAAGTACCLPVAGRVPFRWPLLPASESPNYLRPAQDVQGWRSAGMQADWQTCLLLDRRRHPIMRERTGRSRPCEQWRILRSAGNHRQREAAPPGRQGRWNGPPTRDDR